MPLPTDEKRLALSQELVKALDNLSGYHPGHRPAHAKGQFLAGSFVPTPEAGALSRAQHFTAPSTPVIARFSDSTGLPNVPDNDPNLASPRGFAVRFQLGEHLHTDIIAHSTDGFPTRTAPEFLEFLTAVRASGPDVPSPKPIEQFLMSHPKALAFVQTPKPIPSSFAREAYFAVSAFKLISQEGVARYVRYRILPEAGMEHLTAEEAAARSPDFLMEELSQRLASGPVKMQLWAQLAEEGDVVDDATVAWQAERAQVLLGVIAIETVLENSGSEVGRIIFDPIPRVDGVEPSEDPLLESRADVYIVSGRRRREASAG